MTNSKELKGAHNNVARQVEWRGAGNRRSKNISFHLSAISKDFNEDLHVTLNYINRRLPNEEDTVSCHSITYILFGGFLWELDGFKRGPLRLGTLPSGSLFLSTEKVGLGKIYKAREKKIWHPNPRGDAIFFLGLLVRGAKFMCSRVLYVYSAMHNLNLV